MVSKKLFAALLCFILVGSLFSCKKDKKDEPNSDKQDNSKLACGGTIATGVDLGPEFDCLWAEWNIGASKPSVTGRFVAWGEFTAKNEYEWETYKYCSEGHPDRLTKYCNDKNFGLDEFKDDKLELDAEDDVAHVYWQGNWRIPTKAQFNTLLTKATWTVDTQDGYEGFKVTGTNGNSIFFPAAGWRMGTDVTVGGLGGPTGEYWTRNLDESDPRDAYTMSFATTSTTHGIVIAERYVGRTVRTVRSK